MLIVVDGVACRDDQGDDVDGGAASIVNANYSVARSSGNDAHKIARWDDKHGLNPRPTSRAATMLRSEAQLNTAGKSGSQKPTSLQRGLGMRLQSTHVATRYFDN